MKFPNTSLIFCTILLLISCKSEKTKIEEAKNVVNSFVKDIELENFQSIKSTYPSYSNFKGEIWLLYQFEITDAKLENNLITVYGKYKQFDKKNETIMFVLKEVDGEYIIDHTKGLTAYFKSNLYLFLKNAGCLRNIETDEQISIVCSERQFIFKSLAVQAAKALESSIEIAPSSDAIYLTNSSGFINGEITFVNNSDVDIPAYSYQLYFVFYDKQGKIMDSFEDLGGNHNIIPAHKNITTRINRSLKYGLNNGVDDVSAVLKIIKTDWLESDIVNNPSKDITCAKIDEILKTQ